ncbi:MAG: glycosyltransferase family 87 protein [Isosphaeraceae bacterium]
MASRGIRRVALALGWLALLVALIGLTRRLPATSYHYGCAGSRDFIEYWSAYRVLRSGGNPYDGLVLHRIERTAGKTAGGTLLMWNPPWTVLLLSPVLEFAFPVAALLWIGCNLALLAAIALLLRDASGPVGEANRIGPAIVAALLFYPVMETIALGQVSIVLAFAVALFLRSAVKSDEVGAGLSLVLLTIKPHLFLIFGAWVLGWTIREHRWRVPAAALLGLAALLLSTQLLWPGSIAEWWASLGRAPRGPGAEATSNWLTCSLASSIRLLIFQATGRAPLWPLVAIPLVGLFLTLGYLVRVHPEINWPSVLHPVLCLSVGMAPYGWPFDFAVLVPGQILLVLRVMRPGVVFLERLAVLGALAALLVIPVALESPTFGLHLLAWFPWASLLVWTWANRQWPVGNR